RLNGLDRSDQTTYRLILPRDNDSVERQLILNRLPLRHPSGEDRVVTEHSGPFTQLRQSDTVAGDEASQVRALPAGEDDSVNQVVEAFVADDRGRGSDTGARLGQAETGSHVGRRPGDIGIDDGFGARVRDEG